MLFYSAGDVKGRALLFRMAVLAIFIGGCARVVSYLTVGEPPAAMLAGMIVELLLPLSILWQGRVLNNTAKPA